MNGPLVGPRPGEPEPLLFGVPSFGVRLPLFPLDLEVEALRRQGLNVAAHGFGSPAKCTTDTFGGIVDEDEPAGTML